MPEALMQMNKNKKLLVLLLTPVLALGLAACNNNGGSTSSTTSNGKVSSTVSSTTPVSTPISSTTTSTIVTPSSTSTSKSSLLDEITGTADERYAAYQATADGEVATAYAELVAVETFTPKNNSNLYFMDGTHAVKAINVNDYAFVQQLEVGKVYKVSGVYDKSKNRLNGKDTDVTIDLVEGGETKVQAVKTNLDNAAATTDNVDTVATASTGVVTDVVNTEKSKNIKVEIAGTTYTVQTRGMNETAVNEVLMAAEVGQAIVIKAGVVYNTTTINVLSVDAFELGTIAEDLNGTLAVGSDAVVASIEGTTITFGGTGAVIPLVDGKNVVSVKVNMPRSAVASEATVKVDEAEAKAWSELAEGESVTLAIEVTDVTAEHTISVVWKEGAEAQVFTVKVASGTKLATVLGEGSVTLEDNEIALTYDEESKQYVVGSDGTVIPSVGEEGNVVNVLVTLPEGAVENEIVYTIDGIEVSNSSLNIEANKLVVPFNIKAAGQVSEVVITWKADTDTNSYVKQTITLKAHNGVKLLGVYSGTVDAAMDGELTVGSVSAESKLTYTVAGNEVTIGGTDEVVAYVAADEATGLAAGNYIGLKITAPADLDASLDPIVVIGGKEVKWSEVAQNGVAEFKFAVSSLDSSTVSVYWYGNTSSSAQVITIKFATGTTLEAKPIKYVESTISELLKKDGSKAWTDTEQLYKVEAIVSDITNTTFGNGKLMDPVTGEEITLYGMTSSESAFDNETLKYTNAKDFSSLGLAKGDKVLVAVQYLVYGYSAPYTQEVQGYLVEKIADVNDVKYTIAVSGVSEEKGSVELDKTEAAMGEKVVATVTAKEGYAVAKVEFNGVTLVANEEGKYEFTAAMFTNNLVVEYGEDVQYDLTINTPENGTAALSATKAKIGEEVTVTVSPAEGYKVNYVKVNGESIKPNDSGAYVFTVSGTTAVEVAFMDATTQKSSKYVISKDVYASNTTGAVPTTLSNFINEGDEDIVTKLEIASGSKAYYGNGYPIRFGSSSSKKSTITLTLSADVTSITIRATSWNNVTTALSIEGSVEETITLGKGASDGSTYEDVTFTFESGVKTITISSSERYEISAFTFIYA